MKSRVVQYNIARLKDKRTAIRLEAIEQLRLLNATEALDELKNVYETDAEVTVRQAAQKAGLDIFMNNHASSSA